jgi:hypothetical protein
MIWRCGKHKAPPRAVPFDTLRSMEVVMSDLRNLYLLDARLSYIEQILALLGIIQVDPPPSDFSRLGRSQLEAYRRPGPIVDPAVSDRVRLAESLLHRPPQGDPAAADRVRLAELLLRRPQPGDPAVSDRVRLAELLLRRPLHGDPAVTDRVRLEGIDPLLAEWISRLLIGGDPPPEDIGRLTVAELEATLQAVSENAVRLRSIEGLLNERLKELRDQAPGGR